MIENGIGIYLKKKKNPCLSGSAQLKPVLFKGRLYASRLFLSPPHFPPPVFPIPTLSQPPEGKLGHVFLEFFAMICYLFFYMVSHTLHSHHLASRILPALPA